MGLLLHRPSAAVMMMDMGENTHGVLIMKFWAETPAARSAAVKMEAESDFMVDSGRATTCLWERDERDVGERLPVDASEPYIRAALPGVCLVHRRHRLNLASYHPRTPQLLLHPGVVALAAVGDAADDAADIPAGGPVHGPQAGMPADVARRVV